MTPKQIGPFAQAWYKWKALRLPWRRRFLIGSSHSSSSPFTNTTLPTYSFDLQGNTFWEFRHTRGAQDSAERWRRIVSYPRSTHLSQVKVSPQWHQWLRHARRDPPSLDEQRAEAARQERIKLLAAQADARWEAKPRVMEDPRARARAVPAPEMELKAKERRGSPLVEDEEEGDPWARATAHGPGENWQPAAWDPSAAKKRR
ncbi:uncharacterized protein TRIREDRAFT_73912 [Trichoderma reesei QM6a]|uniref:Predicted protein n=1 Tax=Hypocrea jecorina (strain QM6a) TaxID=431241 RepID=G0R823_HYPJQ|nr:uncharacterized protein TRIREDRAFT_73912 [Trichoderma reesei QM6a]EGR52294.1 predicted protein [Trichoderma reesei QM6a]